MDLISLKQQLIELDYPNINILSNDQVADVFNADNRRFLLTWLIKQIGEFEVPADKVKGDKFLADVIYEHGFCTSSQMLKFVKADMTLGLEQQLNIIITILQYIKAIKNQNVPLITTPMSTEEIKAFQAMDANLMPSFANKKNMTDDQRQAKVDLYKEKVDVLENEIDLLKLELAGPNVSDRAECMPNVEAVQDSVSDFKDVSRNISSFESQDQAKVGFSEEFAEQAAGCQQEINVTTRYMQNICNILNINDEFEEPSIGPPTNESERQWFRYIEAMSGIATHVNDMLSTRSG